MIKSSLFKSQIFILSGSNRPQTLVQIPTGPPLLSLFNQYFNSFTSRWSWISIYPIISHKQFTCKHLAKCFISRFHKCPLNHSTSDLLAPFSQVNGLTQSQYATRHNTCVSLNTHHEYAFSFSIHLTVIISSRIKYRYLQHTPAVTSTLVVGNGTTNM